MTDVLVKLNGKPAKATIVLADRRELGFIDVGERNSARILGRMAFDFWHVDASALLALRAS